MTPSRPITIALSCTLMAMLTGCSSSARQGDDVQASPGALAPAPARVAIDVLSTDDWKYAGAPGSVVRTTHYRIFSNASSHALRERAPAYLEHALAHYRSALGPLPLPTVRLDTYLLDNRTHWAALTRQLMGEQAETLLKIPRGGYASRGVGVFFDIGLYDTLAIAAHEGWHQYTQRAFRESLPVWLEEGVASYMEGHRWNGVTPHFLPWANIERFDQLRRAHNTGSLMPLSQLLGSRPQDYLGDDGERILTYYAQLWALTHFLAEGESGRYAPALRALLADAAGGRLRQEVAARLGDREAGMLATRIGPALFLAYFNIDLPVAERQYAAFLDAIVRTGSRDAVAQGRSPLAPSH